MADVVEVQMTHAQRFCRLAELPLDPALLHRQGQVLHAGPDLRVRRHDAPLAVLRVGQQERIAHHLGRQDLADPHPAVERNPQKDPGGMACHLSRSRKHLSARRIVVSLVADLRHLHALSWIVLAHAVELVGIAAGGP